MGIAKIALDASPPLSNGQTWKKVPQTILGSLYTTPLTGNAHILQMSNTYIYEHIINTDDLPRKTFISL